MNDRDQHILPNPGYAPRGAPDTIIRPGDIASDDALAHAIRSGLADQRYQPGQRCTCGQIAQWVPIVSVPRASDTRPGSPVHAIGLEDARCASCRETSLEQLKAAPVWAVLTGALQRLPPGLVVEPERARLRWLFWPARSS